MLAQSLAQVPVKYVSVQCKGGLFAVLYGINQERKYYLRSHFILVSHTEVSFLYFSSTPPTCSGVAS